MEFNHYGLQAIQLPTSEHQLNSQISFLWEGKKSFLHLTQTLLIF